MKWIDVIIPTRNRPEKLLRTLESIPSEAGGVKINVLVGFDADPKTAGRFSEYSGIRECVVFTEQRGSIAIRNALLQKCDDAVLYATDDIVFKPGAIESAVETMKTHFPDDDGLVGFKVENDKAQCPAGVGLAGSLFLQRFPGKTMFHPGYFHFGAQEVHRAAVILKKFAFDPNARILHFHPAFYPDEMDRTHIDARAARAADMALSSSRRRKQLTWGING